MISNNPPQSDRANVFQHYQAAMLLFSPVPRWKSKNWFRSCAINRTDRKKKKVLLFLRVFSPSPYWIYFLETATSSIFSHIKPNSETNRKIWWPDEYKELIKRRGKWQITRQELISTALLSVHGTWSTWRLRMSTTALLSFIKRRTFDRQIIFQMQSQKH